MSALLNVIVAKPLLTVVCTNNTGTLQEIFEHWQQEYNVSGFLVPAQELDAHPDLRNLTLALNADLNPGM